MNTFAIADLEKALKYAKAQNAVVVSIQTHRDFDRLHIGISEAYKGAAANIVVFSSESAKLPEITRTETLF